MFIKLAEATDGALAALQIIAIIAFIIILMGRKAYNKNAV
jgi:hypothetical protein